MSARWFLVLAVTCIPCLSFGQDCDALTKRGAIQKLGTLIWATAQLDLANHGDSDLDYLIVERDDSTFNLRLQKGVLTPPAESKTRGVTLAFADGSKIDRVSQKVAAKARGNVYKLSVVMPLTKSELTILSQQKLTGISIADSSVDIDEKAAISINEMIPCLLK